MRERWEQLDLRWQTPTQGYGRQATGCGATVGVQPRCDFQCAGCYLPSDANRIPPLSLPAVFEQLSRLREHLGPRGNVQITDGEVTLRPERELVAILRHARSLGLIPMLMTHGDTFRRRPSLLPHLMVEGGLTELAIHIDTTQKGRLGYRDAIRETSLHSLREEFANMIREARHTTGRALRVATTLTLTRQSLDAVPSIVEWCFRNRDAFRMVSFQPVAQVGRTENGMERVGQAELWDRISAGLGCYGFETDPRESFSFGHPACSRVASMAVFQVREQAPSMIPILRRHHPEDREILDGFLSRAGGINFRDDTPVEAACRAAGIMLRHPGWFLGPGRRWLSRRAKGLGTTLPTIIRMVLRGKARIDGFSVVSHHFMNPAELRSPEGRERLQACVFRLPVGEEMISMCELNGSGRREGVYEDSKRAYSTNTAGRPGMSTEDGISGIPDSRAALPNAG